MLGVNGRGRDFLDGHHARCDFRASTPKSDAGSRDVPIPPHLLPALREHLSKHVGKQPNSLLFPVKHGGHLAPATLYRQFYKARVHWGGQQSVSLPRVADA